MNEPTYIGRKIVVEIGGMQFYNRKTSEAKKLERQLRDDVDRVVRAYFSVGPYHKFIKTRLVDD